MYIRDDGAKLELEIKKRSRARNAGDTVLIRREWIEEHEKKERRKGERERVTEKRERERGIP